MTKKQIEQFNKMRHALLRISKGYQTTKQLFSGCDKEYGLMYTECLEYAYENIQQEAKNACKGVKEISVNQ